MTDDKPCVRCGARDRYADGHCKPCARKNARDYRAANPERHAENNRAYYAANRDRAKATAKANRAANPERIAEYNRAYREANKEHLDRYQRAWREANPEYKDDPEKSHARDRRRRAREAGVLSEDYTLVQVAARCCGLCGICGERVDLDLAYPHPKSRSVDHIIPLSAGGPDTLANVQLACMACNAAKGNRVA